MMTAKVVLSRKWGYILIVCNYTQDEMSPFSRLNGDSVVTEWQLKEKMRRELFYSCISVTIQWPLSQLNGRHISETFKSIYFLTNKITSDVESTLNIGPRGPLFNRRNILDMCSLCLKMFFEVVFLIFYRFYNN